jgi:uncharacterized protein YpmB
MKRKFILGAILILALIGVVFYFYSGSQVPAGQARLQSLTRANVSLVKDSFNAAREDARVLLLLSPT